MDKRKISRKNILRLLFLLMTLVFVFVFEISSKAKEKNMSKQTVGKGQIIQEKDKIKFVDRKGRVIKVIPYGYKFVKTRVITKIDDGMKRKVRSTFFRMNAVVNNTKEFVAVTETISESLILTEEEKMEIGDTDYGFLGSVYTIIYYDTNGNELWRKSFKKGINAGVSRISDDGEYIVIYAGCGEDCSLLEDTEPFEAVYVYNKGGKELFRFPKERNEYRVSGSLIEISPNGRYLAVFGSVGIKKGKNTMFFFDLKNNTFWDPEERYVIYGISNDGITEYTDKKTLKPVEIDLKKYLGD